jgi:c-di-GMP-binding flagellar brake protein YcgR
MREKRRAFRLAGPFAARCRRVEPSGAPGSAFTATVLDLSASGARLSTREDLGFAREVFVQVEVGETEVAADAQIVRRDEREGSRLYSVAFTGLTAAERAAISRLVFSELRRREGANEPAA